MWGTMKDVTRLYNWLEKGSFCQHCGKGGRHMDLTPIEHAEICWKVEAKYMQFFDDKV